MDSIGDNVLGMLQLLVLIYSPIPMKTLKVRRSMEMLDSGVQMQKLLGLV